LKQKTSCPSG